jgi:uncharacterized protein
MVLSEKKILITGANRGIGLAFAQRAAKENMNLHLLCRHTPEELPNELLKLGAKSVQFWNVDLLNSKDIEKFYSEFKETQSTPDIIVNNAGQLTGGLLEEQSMDKIYNMLQVNLGALIHLTRLFLPDMLKLKEAKIVNNASVSGIMYLPCVSTYAAAKAGVIAFTESLRNELKGTSVSTLLMVTPGVKTRMYDEIPELYSNHVDLKFLNSIPTEEWIDQVFKCIKKDKSICWPKGSTYWGVKMGQHFPKILGKISQSYFKR